MLGGSGHQWLGPVRVWRCRRFLRCGSHQRRSFAALLIGAPRTWRPTSSIVHRPPNAWPAFTSGSTAMPAPRVGHSEQPLHHRFLTRRTDMVPRRSRLAVRRHHKVVVVLAVSIALALSALGIDSASASTRSGLAVSLNPDRSSAARLNGSTVKGKIYVFVRSSKTLKKVDFYLDSPRRTKQPPAKTDKQTPFDLAGTAADGTARAFDTSKLADGSHTIRAVMTSRDGTTATRRGHFKVHNGGVKPTPSPSPMSTTNAPAPAATPPAATTTAPAATTTATPPPPPRRRLRPQRPRPRLRCPMRSR